jgi:hypothetical protein
MASSGKGRMGIRIFGVVRGTYAFGGYASVRRECVQSVFYSPRSDLNSRADSQLIENVLNMGVRCSL